MKISKEKQIQVLSAIGLIVGPNDISYDESKFKKYISQEYLNSERKETDEIYRMFEPSLIHRDSGLRITYTTTESYYGDSIDYKVIDIFIITLTKRRLEIVDVDFNKRVFSYIERNDTIYRSRQGYLNMGIISGTQFCNSTDKL